MALDTENMNVYKVETDNDIYNVVRNYDINKLFDKLIVPNATKEQLKDNLKKALNEKNNDEALRILNYLLKYKHNYYKRNDILLDDESPSSQEKTITLKDAGYYEIIMEAASAKSPWFNKDGENFEHFLVGGSPWTNNIPTLESNNVELCLSSQKCLFLLKNFNYVLINKTDDTFYTVYIGNYELNDKGCFLFKKYYNQEINAITLESILSTLEDIKYKTYQNIETYISNIISSFQKFENNDLLDYFEYNSSAFAAYGSRQIFLETFKVLLYSKINIEHKVYLKGSEENESDIKDAIGDNIIFDEVNEWTHSSDKTYQQKHYYNRHIQTKNLSPTGESSYLSKVIKCDANSQVSYRLQGFEDDQNSSLTLKNLGTTFVLEKPTPKEINKSNFDRNYNLVENVDHKYVGLVYGFDYDNYSLNSSFDGFIGGGKKGYGPHMNHQDNCYWTNGENSHIQIKYLGDSDSILKRVFFQNDSFSKSGKRLSIKGEKSSIKGFDYIDVPSGSILEFKYKCSSSIKSLNFDKCFITVLKNDSSVYNSKYSIYGYEDKLDTKSINTNELLSKLNKTEDILFTSISENTIDLSKIYQIIGNNKWTMSELFFNNSHLVDGCENFINFKIDKDWNYYTLSFRVFDNMILDFGNLSDEVDYYNNVILDSLDKTSVCNEQLSQKEYFNKSNTHDEKNFIKEISFTNESQDRIIDDNLNTLYNKNYYNTVSFDSDNSTDHTVNSIITDSERTKDLRLDKYHDYRVFCELFEKIYITIKSGNQIDLNSINYNVPFGDYEAQKSGYITDFYFKRTAISEQQVYNKRISVKQGEFIYFKCEYNSCRIEIDEELSSMPIDTVVYPVNYDPFENKFYSLNPDDYQPSDTYKGYKKGGTNEKTFQWIRFLTSNSSYDLVIFLKKIVVEINFLNNLFGEDIITKNFSSNKLEPNESFSFNVKLPKICRISNLRYSKKETYSYVEDEKTYNKEYFNENCYESFISFYSQNSNKVIKNFENYIYDLPDILSSYSGSRQIFEVFKNTFSSLSKKTIYFSDEIISFSLQAKYANSHIRISEDYIIGSTLFENFPGKFSNHILCNGIYRIISNSGNTGNGGNGGEIVPEKIYATILSGSGGGGLYGGNSGKACQNNMLSPIDGEHPIIRLKLTFCLGFSRDFGWFIHTVSFWIIPPQEVANASYGWTKVSGKTKGTLGLTCWLGLGSGTGGQGFYEKGHTAGDGGWFLGVLKDTLVDEKDPLNTSSWDDDDDWFINKAFRQLKNNANTTQKNYFSKCFGEGSTTSKHILRGANYLENAFNERYRGAFLDAIISVNSNKKNNKTFFFSSVGSTGINGLNGENSVMEPDGYMSSMPKDGICGQEGKPTQFEFDSNSYYNILSCSYFTNIKDGIINNKKLKLNKGLLCGGVHDINPQKSLDTPSDFNYPSDKTPILGWISHFHKSGRPVTIMGKDAWSNSAYKVDTFTWDSMLNTASFMADRKNTFSSFMYVSFTYFWVEIVIDFRLLDVANPIDINILEGFKYLTNPQDQGESIGIKYRPKLLPFCWDTKSHTAYTISNTNSRLSRYDVNDSLFSKYSPTKYLNMDVNTHYRSEYPIIYDSGSSIDDDALNELFYDPENPDADKETYVYYDEKHILCNKGDRYNKELKTNIYNFINCYNNLNGSLWNDNNIFKNDTLCISNIGLTKTANGDGRLLKLAAESPAMPTVVDNALTLSKDKIDIQNNHLYKCIFQLGSSIYELPLNGFDSALVSTLKKILTTNITLIDDDMNPTSYSMSNIIYSSETFVNVTVDSNNYKITESIIPSFKNPENLIAVFKISNRSKNVYDVSCCCNDINPKKFILEIKDKFKDDAVIYNSLQTLNKTITFDNISNISISTTYSKMVIKNNNDYYIIIYDKNNYLYSTITHNNIIDSYDGKDSQRYLNYFLEYTTSRGRIPIMDSCMSSLIFLGRNPENLTDEDAKKIKWAYIYSGNIYEYKSSYNRDDLSKAKINLNSDLHPIDDNSTCVALIDYERLCRGNIILNQSNSDWLKI